MAREFERDVVLTRRNNAPGPNARSLATCRGLDSEGDRARRRSGGWFTGKQNQATRSLVIGRNLHDVQSKSERSYGRQNGP